MKRILLIDDEEGIRIVWKRFHDLAEPVFRGQLEMHVASDLEQGLERLKSGEYDIVILDLELGDSPQLQTISYIFEHAEELPPVIVLTGDEDIYVRRRCMIAGAADFWIKGDATENPDLLFKSIYNEYLKRYASRTDPAA